MRRIPEDLQKYMFYKGYFKKHEVMACSLNNAVKTLYTRIPLCHGEKFLVKHPESSVWIKITIDPNEEYKYILGDYLDGN